MAEAPPVEKRLIPRDFRTVSAVAIQEGEQNAVCDEEKEKSRELTIRRMVRRSPSRGYSSSIYDRNYGVAGSAGFSASAGFSSACVASSLPAGAAAGAEAGAPPRSPHPTATKAASTTINANNFFIFGSPKKESSAPYTFPPSGRPIEI
jgi:hypothetical protein